MTEDLLAKIRREVHERMDRLRPAVEEHDRLQSDLQALDAHPASPASPELPTALDLNFQSPVALDRDPEPSAAVLCFPSSSASAPARLRAASPRILRSTSAQLPPTHTRIVSSKILRLMHTPPRAALERPGIPRVGHRSGT